MKRIGNLFNLAERRLIREKKLGLIPCYTELDVIEYAIEIRRFFDHNSPSKIKKIMKLTPKELKRKNQASRHRYFLKTGR